MPRVTVTKILKACEDAVPEIERISNWYGYRSDGFPWSVLAGQGKVHLPGVGWMRTVETWQEPKSFDKPHHLVIVFKVDDDDSLFMKTGWWNSWDDNPFEGGLEKVERYEKTVIAYRKVDE